MSKKLESTPEVVQIVVRLEQTFLSAIDGWVDEFNRRHRMEDPPLTISRNEAIKHLLRKGLAQPVPRPGKLVRSR